MGFTRNDFVQYVQSKYPNMVQISFNDEGLKFYTDPDSNSVNLCYVRQTRSCPILDILLNI